MTVFCFGSAYARLNQCLDVAFSALKVLFAEKKLIVYLPLLVSMYCEYLDPNMHVWFGSQSIERGAESLAGCSFGENIHGPLEIVVDLR